MTYADPAFHFLRVKFRNPRLIEQGCAARDPGHVPSVRQITGLRALGLVYGAENPNAEPLHMRLKRRALHPQHGGGSLGTGDDPIGLFESG